MDLSQSDSNIVHLEDGRALCFAEYGRQDGFPIYFFHGGNDCRLEAALLASAADELNIRLIAPDRPGYGRSDFQSERVFLDWPKDIDELSNFLGLDNFSLLGHSGGGSHVTAVASKLSERVISFALVSSPAPPGSSNKGLGPMFRLANFAMARSPWLNKKLTENQAHQLHHKPERMIAGWRLMSKADGQLFDTRPDVTEIILAEMREAIIRGIQGILHEHPLYKKPWGFELDSLKPPAFIWHGLADKQASPAWGRFLETAIPGSETHFVSGEGHFSTLVNYQEEILRKLMGVR